MGSGGSSGNINYPTYMKEIHQNWLAGLGITGGKDEMTLSVTNLMNTAMDGDSPYFSFTFTDPDNVFLTRDLHEYETPYSLLEDLYGLDVESDYDSYISNTAVNALVDAFSASLQDVQDEVAIPAFLRGYTNINATMGSAATIGLAKIASDHTREVAKFDAQARIYIQDVAIKRVGLKVEWRRIVSHMSTETARIYLAAKNEEDEANLTTEAKDLTWDLEMYQYGSNVMASAAGGVGPTGGDKKSSKTQSAIGGALAGAAAGAATGAAIGAAGGPITATGGAIIGATLGIASAYA